MGAVILVDHHTVTENQEKVSRLLTQLQAKAALQRRCLSWVTSLSADNRGSHLVISRWRSFEDWRAWEKSSRRLGIVAKLDRLLKTPAVTTVYFDSPTGASCGP